MLQLSFNFPGLVLEPQGEWLKKKMVTHVRTKVLQTSQVYVFLFRASLALAQCLEQLGEAKTLHAYPRSTRSLVLEAAKYFSAPPQSLRLPLVRLSEGHDMLPQIVWAR